MKPLKLEPEYQESYDNWSKNPSPEMTGKLMSLFNDQIDRSLQSHKDSDRHLLKAQAKKIIIDSLPRYNPEKAGLKTFLSQQLQGLSRQARSQINVTGIPERKSIELYNLQQAENDFYDQNDRVPSTKELSDFAGISTAKIDKLRRYSIPVNTGSYYGVDDEEDFDRSPDVTTPLSEQYKMEYVLSDLTHQEQVIAEHDYRLYGRKQLSTEELAKKLGVSLGTISNRRKLIASKLQSAEKDLFDR